MVAVKEIEFLKYRLVKKVLPGLFFVVALQAHAQVQFTAGSLKITVDKKEFAGSGL